MRSVRRGEQRAITVNWVRGNSVLEAAQKGQSKELGKGPANGNPEAVASDDTPLMVTFQEKEESPDAQDPEVDTDVKGLEGPSPMDLE